MIQLPTEPILGINEINGSQTNLFMLNKEYKENILHYNVDDNPDPELLIRMWEAVCLEER